MSAVINIMEDLTEDLLNKHWQRLDLPCYCEQCKKDTLALALNQLPPKYASHEAGQAYIKAQYLTEESRVSILLAIVEAAKTVALNPRHLQ